MFFGRVLGLVFGLLCRSWIIALVGFIVGHRFDREAMRNARTSFYRFFAPYHASSSTVRSVFFRSTFLMMGYIAKADGRVSTQELEFARGVMQRMGLNAAQTLEAMQLFTSGKDPTFPFDATLSELSRACRNHFALIQMFLEIQLQLALADDGYLSREADGILRTCAARLGVSAHWVEIRTRTQRGARFNQQRRDPPPRGSTGSARWNPESSALQAAYQRLGVPSTVTDSELKKAYRKLMSTHHPDKLAAKGLPPEMMRLATEKAQEIQSAYEQISRARGLKGTHE